MNTRSEFSIFSRTALSVAVAIVAAAPAFAQNTTAAIAGRVTSADGKPLSGAAITIVHLESGSANNLITDAEGRYQARGLRVGGPYTITVVKGSDKEVRNGVYLQLAESLALDVKLGGNVLSTVTIAGSSNGNSGCQGVECCQAAESDCASDGYSESEAMGKTK